MTKIEWAHAGLGRGKTWNPIRARNLRSGADEQGWHCEKVSPACAHCYAERWNQRPGIGGTGLAYKPGHRADVEHYLDEQTLLAPLHWKQPTGIFVCSMTDIFGAWVSDEWLDKIFAVAALCPQHIFIFLTKRPKRMREYITSPNRAAKIERARIAALRSRDDGDYINIVKAGGGPITIRWPLPNVWLGVTAEDQQRADERIPDLLATPAAIRFVSCEPLLGAIDLRRIRLSTPDDTPAPECKFYWNALHNDPRLGWVITGGETGPGARPTHIDWERSIRDQCAAADVAYFRKQIGEWKAVCEMSEEEIDACYHPAPESAPESTRREKVRSIVMHRDGAVFDNPIASGAFEGGKGAMTMFRVGRRRAGHLLDGREHREFPEARR